MDADRDPELAGILASSEPSVVTEDEWDWHGAPLPFRISGHLGAFRLPEHLVTSVRCLVSVAGRLVVCETPRDTHIWPGGRREGGESFGETAAREVLEETGWKIDPASLAPVGFLHFEHLVPPPAGYPYPSPDFLQLVLGAAVAEPADQPENWTDDVGGWELRSYLADPAELAALPLDDFQRVCASVFLAAG
ncbi:NUDIX domain-containing protein [Longispora albida]|uniref:NUDIX domain-containing protein n=1 Tax=Longispora albida TaxID=203523 RepID=UPI00035C5249|nr:NUDIX domain-containing protein [Longispora albida]